MHAETRGVPPAHDFVNQTRTELPFLFQHLEHSCTKQLLQGLQIYPRHHVKGAFLEKQPVRHQQVQMQMPFAVAAKGLDRHHGPKAPPCTPNAVRKKATRLWLAHRQSLLNSLWSYLKWLRRIMGILKDVLAMGNGAEDGFFQVFAELNPLFAVAAGAEPTAPATEGIAYLWKNIFLNLQSRNFGFTQIVDNKNVIG
jgi:hypothetical protein